MAQPSDTEIINSMEERLIALVENAAEPLPDIADDGFAHFIDRFGDSKVILLGESTHGTDEFYRARAAITERLVLQYRGTRGGLAGRSADRCLCAGPS